jgi:glutamate synthase domain-containing protein 2
MSRNLQKVSARDAILLALFGLNVCVLAAAILVDNYWLLAVLSISISALCLAVHNVRRSRHTILRNFPVVGYFRYFFESIRPELRQYFGESDLDGRPFSRRQRSIVYQRAKNVRQTVPFGMQDDPGRPGHEWVAHSSFPVHVHDKNLRVRIGNRQCDQPYDASILNIGAMSYGALSKTAISALNEGAALENFAHNTGEGSISDYHMRGGDLVWQIGTGYFGCRDTEGYFFPELFQVNASRKNVKMIELKLSQGAKPGHGGILPAEKNTPEIASIRNVEPHTTVYSPPAHSAFSNPIELMQFIRQLRALSGGKPVGFKLCIGDKQEFIDICNAIVVTRIVPDFITVDGSEGGTGAAPLEFTDNIGMPLHDALAFVTQTLEIFNLKRDISIIAAGRIITAFDILKVLSLGASACYSARGMMMSMGCIQALKCDSGECPVGIATQRPSLYKGLNVTDKRVRVANFHKNTLGAVVEMMEACGFKTLNEIHPSKFFRKVDTLRTKSFREIYFNNTEDRQRDTWLEACTLN